MLITLEEKIGYTFSDKKLLETALTHSSYANERRSGISSNERLEFLGDSVLGVTVAEYLYTKRPDLPEGKMTRLRADLVCEAGLHRAALSIGLGEHLLLGKGEDAGGGRERPSVLSDALEAIIAAVFIDGGKNAVTELISKLILSRIGEIESLSFDYKTALQEYAQKSPGTKVIYNLKNEAGPEHQKTFCVEVIVGGKNAGAGEGKSKKAAEQEAAHRALEAFGEL